MNTINMNPKKIMVKLSVLTGVANRFAALILELPNAKKSARVHPPGGPRGFPSQMATLFDIFYLRADGQLIWQCATADLAKVWITLMTIQRGDYVISNQKTGHKTLVKVDGSSASFVEQASRVKSTSDGS